MDQADPVHKMEDIKMAWKIFFKVVRIKPCLIDVAGVGRIDLRKSHLPLTRVKAAYDAGCPYLMPTDKAIEKWYPNQMPDELAPDSEDDVLIINNRESSGSPADDVLDPEQLLDLLIEQGKIIRNGSWYLVGDNKCRRKDILENLELLNSLAIPA